MSERANLIDPSHLGDVTFRGPPIDDPSILHRTPPELKACLSSANGYILFHGGLHVRGACAQPIWHSLRAAWEGPDAFHRLYSLVELEDVPFAQDCMGDQFLLRDHGVMRLSAETDEIVELGLSLEGFLDAVAQDAEGFLNFNGSWKLEPGQLLNAYPPFCMKEGGDATLTAAPALDVVRWHADLARQIRGHSDGTKIKVQVSDD